MTNDEPIEAKAYTAPALIELRPAVGDLVAAIAEAQAELQQPRKARTANIEMRDGGAFGYSYAGLADILLAVGPVFGRLGVAIVQDVRALPGVVSVTTTLRLGEQSLTFGPLELPIAKGDAQGIGSALTYARRYGLSAALGIAAVEDDDDGAAASEPARKRAAPAEPEREALFAMVFALAKIKGVSESTMVDWAGRHLGIETLEELDAKGAREMARSLRDLPDAPPDDASSIVGAGGDAPAAGTGPSGPPDPAVEGRAGDGSGASEDGGEVAGAAATKSRAKAAK